MLVEGHFLICIGLSACSNATDQRCAIALGDNVRLPAGRAGDHVLATPAGVRPLERIDAVILGRINAEILRVMGEVNTPLQGLRALGAGYVASWNRACSMHPLLS